MDFIEQQLKHSSEVVLLEIKDYADSRKRDIKRGAETPRLAVLMIDKYAVGAIKTLETVARSFDRNVPNIRKEVDNILFEICPDFKEQDKARWEAHPADLSLTNLPTLRSKL